MRKITTLLAVASMIILSTGCATSGSNASHLRVPADEANPYQTRSHTDLSVEQLPPAGYIPLK